MIQLPRPLLTPPRRETLEKWCTSRGAIPIIAAVLAFAPHANAQSWRTVHATRQAQDGDSLRVNVEYSAGSLRISPAAPELLYDVRFRYDADKFDGARRFDSLTRTLTVGMDDVDTDGGIGFSLARLRRGAESPKDPNELAIALGRGTSLDLRVVLSAVEGTLDLSGLSVSRLRLNSRASDTRVTFSAPNPVPMEWLEIEGGATSINILGIGNANPRRLDVRASMGNVELDLGGAWSHDAHVRVEVALGHVSLRIPHDAGVRIKVRDFLSRVGTATLVKREDFYESENWTSARYRLTIDAGATLGAIQVAWIAR